jgi:hypothetical protein
MMMINFWHAKKYKNESIQFENFYVAHTSYSKVVTYKETWKRINTC